MVGKCYLTHLHFTPLTPDMNSSNFDLFPKLNELTRGQKSSSLEDFPKRGDAVIEKQGDRIEGI